MSDDVLAGLKAKIEGEFRELVLTARKSLGHIRAIGQFLISCQEETKAQGIGFEAWVEHEFQGQFTYQTGWNWMTVARQWDEFTEEERATLTMKQMLKVVAERRRKDKPVESTPVVDQPPVLTFQPAPGNGVGSLTIPPARPATWGDESGPSAVGGMTGPEDGDDEFDPEGESAVAPLPVQADTTDDDRIAAVAEKYGLPLDPFRAALIELGRLP